MEIPSFQLLFAFLLFLFMLVKIGKRSKTQYQNTKLPPGPSKLPIIGSSHHLQGLPHHSLANLAKEHGPIMHLQLGEVSTVIISSAEMAKEVAKTHDLMFVDRFVVYATNVTSYGCIDVAFSPYGDYWRQLRKICVLEILSAKRVQSFQKLREEEVSNLMQSISATEGSLVNLSEKIFLSMNDIYARQSFGKKCKDKEAFTSALKLIFQITGGFSVVDFYPSLKFLPFVTGMKTKIYKAHRELDRVLENIIKDHKENRKTKNSKKEGQEEEDLVDVLLRLQEDDHLEVPIGHENSKALILNMFGGGSDTSAAVVEWAMAELLRSPGVLEKAQAELRQVLNGKRDVKEIDIRECHYLKSVVKEALRLHPSLAMLGPRECRGTCEIAGYEIPAKTKVIINAWAIGRDPAYWKDPEKFKPERFDGISVDYKGNDFEYIPFGAGRRICPGISLGVVNVELMLAQLLYRFDWKLPNGVKPEELDMTEVFGAAVRRKNDLYATAIPYAPLCVQYG